MSCGTLSQQAVGLYRSGLWGFIAAGRGALSRRAMRLNPLSINVLCFCLWVKFTIDKGLTCCVSGTYPPRLCRPEKPTWNHPTFHLFPQSSRKAPAEFRFAPSTLRNFVPPGAAHEAAAGHTLSEPSGNSASRATTVARRALRRAPCSHSRNRRAEYCG